MHNTAYLAWLLDSTPAAVRAWVGEAPFTASMRQELEETIQHRTDPSQAASYAQACPIPGARADEYLLRERRVQADATVLAGIHFYGLDIERPFVGVFAQSRHFTPHEVLAATQWLCEDFATFQPQAVQWWSAADRPDLRTLPGAVSDLRLVAGPIEAINRLPLAMPKETLRLIADADGASYPAYAELYARALAANPAWKGKLQRTTEEEYTACAHAGGLYVVEVDGDYAGVIAALPDVVRGIPGWVMMEEMLDTRFRGRGLARPMQRLLLARLDTQRHRLVLGTINDANLPSLRTARGAGREEVGGWVFLPAGEPALR
ncbi:MAG: hypothetical protein WAU00_06355 [Caldilinea sp.]